MKKLKNVLLSAAIVLIGASAAFATYAAKSTNNSLETGYYFNGSNCVSTNKTCSTTGTILCTWTDDDNVIHSLSKFVNPTTCGSPLYRP
jgi:hypothetical protein